MISIFLVVVIIFLLLLLSMIWPPDSPWAPWWKISNDTSRLLIKELSIKKNDVVYELGSGDGEFIIAVVRNTPVKQAIGIEIDPFRYVQSRIRKYMQKADKALFIKKNFFDVNISPATIVFIYLVPRALERLLPKFEKELQKNTVVVSYKYQIPQNKKKVFKLHKHDSKNDFYIYKKL